MSLKSNFVIRKRGSNLNGHVCSSKLAFACIEGPEEILTKGVNDDDLSISALCFTEGEYTELQDRRTAG